VNDHLDIGDQLMHIHGYEWGLFANIDEWKWVK
jgi:peptide/nickel transport system substrate-binding protein